MSKKRSKKFQKKFQEKSRKGVKRSKKGPEIVPKLYHHQSKSKASILIFTVNFQANDQSISDGGAPNVEAALTSTQPAQPRKSTIGQRKPQAKKGGLGAKKTGGLGAQKVKKDFAEIEREAELADLGRQKAAEEEKELAKNRQENAEKAAASMRLAYQDLSLEQKKVEEKMAKIDPKKANQVERLGMGVAKKGGFSHSAITEIATIDQEEPNSG